MPDAISVGEESNVMFSINNTGKVMLYNVNAVFEADSIQKNEAYVGNIEPGKSGNVDTMINGIAPTTDDGKVKLSITYEDENGKVSTVEKEIQLSLIHIYIRHLCRLRDSCWRADLPGIHHPAWTQEDRCRQSII